MAQTMHWTIFWTNVFSALIGGILGSTMGAYYKSYSARKGEHRADHEDLPALLERKFAEAERQKAGEMVAIDQHLKEIESHTRAITTVQATIQSQINGDLWMRQMIWTQQRDTYASIFKTIATMRVVIGRLQWELNPDDNEMQSKEAARLLNEFLELEATLEATLGLARCFLHTDAIESLLNERYERTFNPGDSPEVRKQSLRKLESALVAAAKRDLAINSDQPAKPI